MERHRFLEWLARRLGLNLESSVRMKEEMSVVPICVVKRLWERNALTLMPIRYQ